MSFAGTWVPYAYQATYLETPMRGMKPNGFATLKIRAGGGGYATRKRLLKTQEMALQWEVFDEASGCYRVYVDGWMGLFGFVEGDRFEAKVVTAKNIPGLTGMGVYFKRTAGW